MFENGSLFVVVFMISNFIQYILYCYFIDRFLIPKYKKSFWINLIGFTVLDFFILTYLYYYAPFRTLIPFVYFQIVAFLLYKDSLLKTISVVPMIIMTTAIVEFLGQFIMFFIFQQSTFNDAPLSIMIFVFIFVNFAYLIITKLLLYFFHNQIILPSNFSSLYICLMIILLMVSIVVTESLYFNGVFSISTYNNSNYLLVSFSTIIVACTIEILLTIFISKKIRYLKKNVSKELMMQSLSNEYSYLLDEYINTKENDQELQYLRHDIMNYLQTFHTYQNKEEKK